MWQNQRWMDPRNHRPNAFNSKYGLFQAELRDTAAKVIKPLHTFSIKHKNGWYFLYKTYLLYCIQLESSSNWHWVRNLIKKLKCKNNTKGNYWHRSTLKMLGILLIKLAYDHHLECRANGNGMYNQAEKNDTKGDKTQDYVFCT